MSYLPLITKTLLPPPPPFNPAKNTFKKTTEIVIILALKVSAFWVYGLICKGKVSYNYMTKISKLSHFGRKTAFWM